MARIVWTDLPEPVRDRVEAILGSRVVEHLSHPGGFSPGTADRVTCASGRIAFVKAVHPLLNRDSPDIHRREMAVMRSLPTGLPVPAWIDGFELDGWVVLILEYVAGRHPTLPWTTSTLLPVIDDVLALAERLTPCPVDHLGLASEHTAVPWAGFGRCRQNPPPDLSPWVRDHLEHLDHRARRSLSTLDGDTACHRDIRSDNLLLHDGSVVVIDWPWAVRGSPWLDATLLTAEFATSTASSGSHDEMDALLVHVAEHCDVDPEPLVDALIGLTALLTWQSRRPDPAGLPTLRAFQRRQADALSDWLEHTHLARW